MDLSIKIYEFGVYELLSLIERAPAMPIVLVLIFKDLLLDTLTLDSMIDEELRHRKGSCFFKKRKTLYLYFKEILLYVLLSYLSTTYLKYLFTKR